MAQRLLSDVVASLGADVLLDLGESHPEELRCNVHLLEESYLHMRPNMRSERAVAAVHKLARCLALISRGGASIRSSNGVVGGAAGSNTLVIATQKLLFSGGGGGGGSGSGAGSHRDIRSAIARTHDQTGTLRMSSPNDSSGAGGGGNGGGGGGGGDSSDSHFFLGVILGTHLVGAGGMSEEDVRHMSSWMLRSMECVPRTTMISVLDFFTHNAGRVASTFAATVLERAVSPMREDLRLVGDVLEDGGRTRWCRICVEDKEREKGEEGGEGEEEGEERDMSGTRNNCLGESGLNVLHLSTCRVTDDLGVGEEANKVQRMISMMATCMWSANVSMWAARAFNSRELSREVRLALGYEYQMPRWPSTTTPTNTSVSPTATSWWASHLLTMDWTRFTSKNDDVWMSGEYVGNDEERRSNVSLQKKRLLLLRRMTWAGVDGHVLAASAANSIDRRLCQGDSFMGSRSRSTTSSSSSSFSSAPSSTSSTSSSSSSSSSSSTTTEAVLDRLCCYHTLCSLAFLHASRRILALGGLRNEKTHSLLSECVHTSSKLRCSPLLRLIRSIPSSSACDIPVGLRHSLSLHLNRILEKEVSLDYGDHHIEEEETADINSTTSSTSTSSRSTLVAALAGRMLLPKGSEQSDLPSAPGPLLPRMEALRGNLGDMLFGMEMDVTYRCVETDAEEPYTVRASPTLNPSPNPNPNPDPNPNPSPNPILTLALTTNLSP